MVDWNQFPPHILPLLKSHNATKNMRRQPRIFRDTSDFTGIDYGDIIHIDNKYFLVVGYTKEGRFGIEEQPKQWVPKVYDLESGERKILKLVFHENFTLSLGPFKITCYRRPEKESQVLELVRGNLMFMQGRSVFDDAGNLIRILDIITGSRLDSVINRIEANYDDYLANHAEDILRHFLKAVEGIILLHKHGLKHGDIRRDHLLVDRALDRYRWIDFDYDFYLPERPFALDLIGLGNILLYILGRKNYRPVDVLHDPEMGQKVLDTLNINDLSLLSEDRVFNLSKLFPRLPKCFNDILLHFSVGTNVMYDAVSEFYDDLAAGIEQIYG